MKVNHKAKRSENIPESRRKISPRDFESDDDTVGTEESQAWLSNLFFEPEFVYREDITSDLPFETLGDKADILNHLQQNDEQE